MVDIRREYKAFYNKCLYEKLKYELSGDYEDEIIMMKLVEKD